MNLTPIATFFNKANPFKRLHPFSASTAFCLSCPMPNSRKSRFYWISGPYMLPVLCWKIVKVEELFFIFFQTSASSRVFSSANVNKALVSFKSLCFRLRVIHFVDHSLCARLNALWQFIKDICCFMYMSIVVAWYLEIVLLNHSESHVHHRLLLSWGL